MCYSLFVAGERPGYGHGGGSMRPEVWRPPAEPSPAERAVIKAVRRAKLFVFLREHRHELFDERFQAELAEAYVDSPKGQPPVPPARLAQPAGLHRGVR
jgi:hypothetical protein